MPSNIEFNPNFKIEKTAMTNKFSQTTRENFAQPFDKAHPQPKPRVDKSNLFQNLLDEATQKLVEQEKEEQKKRESLESHL